ncbi:hypothetical protein [Mesorhizobium sp. NPDC059025]|uniref:hypothetical protein n=1 Tax=unclassified Mesorhizobium TaxID=325217 RepID=UPI0036CD048F
MEDLRSPINPHIPQGTANAAALGMGQGIGFNMLDEATAGASTLFGGDYDYNLDRMREADRRAAKDHPAAYYSGMLGGAATGGVSLAKGGASMAANVATRPGATLSLIAGGSALDGSIMGLLSGFGSGEGAEDRAKRAAIGAPLGGVLGYAAPYAISAVQGLVSPAVNLIGARLRPEKYAADAIGRTVEKSGSNPATIVKALEAAQADDQPVYTVADALGLSGQRALSTVARNPNEARQTVVEALNSRQAGQGRRITNSLQEAFDTPDTAAARVNRLTEARAAEANQLYGQARKDAGAVNISPVLAQIDETLQPGVHSLVRPNNQIANDSIEGALSRVRSMLSDGKSNLTDFNGVFRAKLDLDDMIEKAVGQNAGNRANALQQVQRVLDNALAEASPSYAQARDAFAAASRRIDAVEAGKVAATRGRSADTIADFNSRVPEEQVGFRAGYVDPLIAQAEGAAVGVDKSRPLISDATGREFPVFAAPGKGRQLWDRLGREKTMFETRNAATGGSRTADNIADAADMAEFDPSVMAKLFRGDVMGAGLSAATRAMNEAKGLPPSVLSRVGQALMITDPAVAAKMLANGAQSITNKAGRRAMASTIMNALNSSVGSKL